MHSLISENKKKTVIEIKKAWNDLKNDNSESLNKLFYEFYDDLYLYGTKLCNDNDKISDSIQEVFIYLWESRKTLTDALHVRAYIFKIFRNKIFKSKKRKIVHILFPNTEEVNSRNFEISHEDLIIEQEKTHTRSELIIKILSELTPKQRETLYLKYYCNLSNVEISETLSIEKQSVSNLLNRSFHVLRKKLKSEDIFMFLSPLIFSQMIFF